MANLLTRDGNNFRVDYLPDGNTHIVEWIDSGDWDGEDKGAWSYSSWRDFTPVLIPAVPEMSSKAKRAWRNTDTLADLGAVTVRWLEGDIDQCPGYCGAVDVDEPLAPGLTAALVALNRAGIVTYDSQAGMVDGDHVQHAAVKAFADPATVDALRRNLPRQYMVRPLGRSRGYRDVPVTLVCGEAVTSYRWMPKRVISREAFPGIGKAALAEVYAADQIVIVDPVEGRNTLWADLHRAVATLNTKAA